MQNVFLALLAAAALNTNVVGAPVESDVAGRPEHHNAAPGHPYYHPSPAPPAHFERPHGHHFVVVKREEQEVDAG